MIESFTCVADSKDLVALSLVDEFQEDRVPEDRAIRDPDTARQCAGRVLLVVVQLIAPPFAPVYFTVELVIEPWRIDTVKSIGIVWITSPCAVARRKFGVPDL